VGLCGNLDKFPDIFYYLEDPREWEKPPHHKGIEGLILTEDNQLFTFNNPKKWLCLDQSIYAIGSGATFALAALETGVTAKEAVKIACKFDPNSGQGVKSYKF
jgi:ATP-dependent protease HslVU (ClpYQ) peptidase subunit